MIAIGRTALLAVGLLLLCVPASLAGWKVTSLAKGGEYNALALDPASRTHISYLDDSNALDYTLKHAYYDGKTWHQETVDSGDVGWWNAIAIDGLGRIHISYLADKPSPSLKYAYFDGLAWTRMTIDTSGGYSTSIAVDAQNRPRIAYVDFSGNLKLATFDGAVWSVEAVAGESAMWFGRTSLAIGPAGVNYIAFSSMSREIRVARDASGDWEVAGAGVGIQPSLALDQAGRLHLAYNDETAQEIIYALADGPNWVASDLTSALDEPGVGESPALALDALGQPRLCFGYYPFRYNVEVLVFAKDDGAGWQYELVDVKNAGYQSSIAVDEWGFPHLSYRRAGKGSSSQLQYADLGIKVPYVVTTALKDARVDRKYAVKVKVKGGAKPYAWQIVSGGLPAGLTLDPLTGKISGVPAAVGNALFKVKVIDAMGIALEQTLSLTVQP